MIHLKAKEIKKKMLLGKKDPNRILNKIITPILIFYRDKIFNE